MSNPTETTPQHITEDSVFWHPDDSGIRRAYPRRSDDSTLEVDCPAPGCNWFIQFDHHDHHDHHDCDCGNGRLVLLPYEPH
ncbi:MAG: hypothetical protein ACOYOQ_14315 [Microthrixaceae bacterium]